tara:strand:+ start:683 stop:988 length:306 start_codon:yes stop_codon:yes gene_type:complete
MNVDTTRVLAVSDVKGLLSIINDTLSAYEYPTSSIFSALSHCAIVSFLIGKHGALSDIESESVQVFRQLNDFAHDSKEDEWFVHWSKRLVDLVRERKLTQE